MKKQELKEFNLQSKVKEIFDWMNKSALIKVGRLEDIQENTTLISAIREGYYDNYYYDLNPLNEPLDLKGLVSFLVDMMPFEEDEVAKEVLKFILLNNQEELLEELYEMIEDFMDAQKEDLKEDISSDFDNNNEIEEEIDNLLSKLNKKVA